jgi:hypothetical protein
MLKVTNIKTDREQEDRMKMKKVAVIAGLVTVLGFAVLQQASARGWGGGYGGGYNCPNYGMNYQQLDTATQAKIDAFRLETTELRKQIAMKRAEKHALMAGQNPDPQAIASVEGELFDLRTEMQKMAKEAGVPAMGGRRGNYGGMGMGAGYHMRPRYNQQGWN